jgi:cobalamin biosynthesis protein CobD/CbiB
MLTYIPMRVDSCLFLPPIIVGKAASVGGLFQRAERNAMSSPTSHPVMTSAATAPAIILALQTAYSTTQLVGPHRHRRHMSRSRLSEQILRVDKWSVCRG